jgi:hypothetical protein
MQNWGRKVMEKTGIKDSVKRACEFIALILMSLSF